MGALKAWHVVTLLVCVGGTAGLVAALIAVARRR